LPTADRHGDTRGRETPHAQYVVMMLEPSKARVAHLHRIGPGLLELMLKATIKVQPLVRCRGRRPICRVNRESSANGSAFLPKRLPTLRTNALAGFHFDLVAINGGFAERAQTEAGNGTLEGWEIVSRLNRQIIDEKQVGIASVRRAWPHRAP